MSTRLVALASCAVNDYGSLSSAFLKRVCNAKEHTYIGNEPGFEIEIAVVRSIASTDGGSNVVDQAIGVLQPRSL